MVVKYGGNALPVPATARRRRRRRDALASFAEDIVLMRSVGMRPVVVHGGGPQIGELMARLGKVPEFRDGLRVTDAETLDIARMVLVGKVNRDIVSAINVHGPLAVGVVRRGRRPDPGHASATPELGFVGDVDARQPGDPRAAAGPGPDPGGRHHRQRRRRPGLQHQRRHRRRRHRRGARRREADLPDRRRGPPARPSTTRPRLISAVSAAELEPLLADGTVGGGMIPKIDVVPARRATAASARAHILDGRVPHALLLETLHRRRRRNHGDAMTDDRRPTTG